jgi:hypothetical protein
MNTHQEARSNLKSGTVTSLFTAVSWTVTVDDIIHSMSFESSKMPQNGRGDWTSKSNRNLVADRQRILKYFWILPSVPLGFNSVVVFLRLFRTLCPCDFYFSSGFLSVAHFFPFFSSEFEYFIRHIHEIESSTHSENYPYLHHNFLLHHLFTRFLRRTIIITGRACITTHCSKIEDLT